MNEHTGDMMPRKVILDVDTGGDDAVAILLAGHHPEIQLVAVTVTYGNGPLETTLDNTLRIVEAGELNNMPVFPGANRPLVSDLLKTDPVQHATLPLPEATYTPQRQRAVDFLVDYYLGPHGPDTYYVPLGPQTNLALWPGRIWKATRRHRLSLTSWPILKPRTLYLIPEYPSPWLGWK
jgi:inosine-uridine nucleoside N-ribohydrolase